MATRTRESVAVRRTNDVVSVVLAGELDLSSSGVMDDAFGIGDGEVEVRVDLSGVTFMDSSALNAILRGHRRVTEAGRRFCVIAASPVVDRLLAVRGVDDVLRA